MQAGKPTVSANVTNKCLITLIQTSLFVAGITKPFIAFIDMSAVRVNFCHSWLALG